MKKFIIARYITREFAESFVFGILVFSVILMLDQVFQLVDLILGKGVDPLLVLRLFLLVIPNILSISIPMAILFGILLAYGRLSEDNEITAFRSVGFGYYTYTAPLLVIVFVMSAFLAYFNQMVAPATHHEFRRISQDIVKQRPLIRFEAKTITHLENFHIYVDSIRAQDNALTGVSIYRFPAPAEDPQRASWRINAASATVSMNPGSIAFQLYSGYWQKPNPSQPENLVHLVFQQYRFVIPLQQNSSSFSQSIKEMKGAELAAEIAAYKEKKLPTEFLETEYWLRWTMALAPFVLAMVAIPLGIVVERGGKSINFGMSLIILFGYYLLLVGAINIGEKAIVPPRIILWVPDAVVFMLGLFLWKKMLRK